MPIDFVAFTADRRISARVFLADDRLSDMLNSVSRLVLRDATVDDLVNGHPPVVGDLSIPIGDLVVVVGTGPRGSDSPRRRTVQRQVSLGLGRYVVGGSLHLPADDPRLPDGDDPNVVLAGRDVLVPLTGATVTYDANEVATTEAHEAVLVNRARATWIDVTKELPVLSGIVVLDEDAPLARAERPTTYLKDFTNSVIE
jgi:hypothetical protein